MDENIDDGQEFILLDSGSAEHVCPQAWHSESGSVVAKTEAGALRDVQGNILEDTGARGVKIDFRDEAGERWKKTVITFTVATQVHEPILSWGKLLASGAEMQTDGSDKCMWLGDVKVPIFVRGHRLYVRGSAGARSRPKPSIFSLRCVAPIGDSSSGSAAAGALPAIAEE